MHMRWNGTPVPFSRMSRCPWPGTTYEIQTRPRSGLAAKNGISIVNAPGTIDYGYRGELKTILINLGTEDFIVQPGDRIAQAVVCPIIHPEIISGTVIDDTTRGSDGFGSTGAK